MTWTPDEARTIGRIETKIDQALSFGPRVSKLETFANRAKGVLAFLSLAGSILAVVLMSGCVTAKTHCAYAADGTLQKAWTRTTIVGKGDTAIAINACKKLDFSTADTGLSDNGVEAFEKAAKAAVRAALLGL
jgi:hypothetical protein